MDKRERIIKKLVEEQRSDGSFGRFHTMNSKLKQKISTTQSAAWIMYENSLTRDHDICNKTCLYMERLLNALTQWPDHWEKNRWYKPAVPLFIASSLALFGSDDHEYKEICHLWINLLVSAFETGVYSAGNLNAKARETLGVDIDSSYIGLHSINNLALYSFNAKRIPDDIQKSYLKWLHHYDGVIGYTTTRLDNTAQLSKNKRVLSLLSKFNGFEEEFEDLPKTLKD